MRRNPPENVEIVVFGASIEDLDMSEDESDFLDQGRSLFEEQGIRVSRSEDVCAVAVHRGDVVGAVTLGKSSEDEGYVYTFSAAVDDRWQRKGISRELIKIAIELANEDPFPHYFRVWVVNPHMVGLLETLGFDTEGRGWSQDSPHMYRYLPMKKNSRLIRPRPETVTQVMRVVKDHILNAEMACFKNPIGSLSPTVTRVRGPGACMEASMDRRMGDRVDIVSKGGRYVLNFGPMLSAEQIVRKVSTFERTRHGGRRQEEFVEDAYEILAHICLSPKLKNLEKYLDFFGPKDAFRTFDHLGSPIKLEVSVFVLDTPSDEITAGVTSDLGGPEDILMIIDLPPQITLAQLKGSTERGSFSGIWKARLSNVFGHESTHVVDPGLGKEKYLGGVEKILGMSTADFHKKMGDLVKSGDRRGAAALQVRADRAYETYASQPLEIRAEAGAWLSEMRKTCVFFLSKYGRVMSYTHAQKIIDGRLFSVSDIYANMTPAAKVKFSLYLIQALQEEGLVSS